MKKSVFIIMVVVFAIACKKKNNTTTNSTSITTPPPPASTCTVSFNINHVKDVNWYPTTPLHSILTFSTNGTYYQDGNYIGTWQFNNCDSIKIVKPVFGYSQRILVLTTDTMVLDVPLAGIVKYYN